MSNKVRSKTDSSKITFHLYILIDLSKQNTQLVDDIIRIVLSNTLSRYIQTWMILRLVFVIVSIDKLIRWLRPLMKF